MAEQVTVATVQIVLPQTDEAEASDALSALLTEHAQQHGAILDWSYLKVGHQWLYPTVQFVNLDEISPT